MSGGPWGLKCSSNQMGGKIWWHHKCHEYQRAESSVGLARILFDVFCSKRVPRETLEPARTDVLDGISGEEGEAEAAVKILVQQYSSE